MGTPTSWLFGDAPDGRLLGTLTFSQLSGVRFPFSALNFLLPAKKIAYERGNFVLNKVASPQHTNRM